MNKAAATNTKARSIRDKIVNVLEEFGAVGIWQIPKDRLCELTGYKSTATKLWATAFKLARDQGIVRNGRSNGEMMVELNGFPRHPLREPRNVESILRKYSKELKIQQTGYDIFDVLLGLGRGRYIDKTDLADAVNKHVATKSFSNSCKLLNSFGIIESRRGGRGANASYRLVQSLHDGSNGTCHTSFEMETKTVHNSPGASGKREEDAQTYSQEAAFSSEHVTIQKDGENILTRNKQHEQENETADETDEIVLV